MSATITTPGFDSIDPSLLDTGDWHGAKPATHKPGEFCGIFEEHFAADVKNIARSDWPQIAEQQSAEQTEELTAQWHHQGSSSTCTGNAACAGAENLALQQLDVGLYLSPQSLYYFCAGGPNTGSSVSCIVRQLANVGVLPYDDDEGRMRKLLRDAGLNEEHAIDTHHNWYYRKSSIGWPSRSGEWRETAKHIRLREYYDVRSFEGFITALALGFNVHYGRTGHSILGRWFGFSGGQLRVKYQDSYNRYGYDSENYIRRYGAVYGAIAYRAIWLSDPLMKAAGVPTLAA